MGIVTRSESKFFKEQNPHFDSGAKYGRDADTIIVYVLKTPTGKFSKYWATLRFNSERDVKDKRGKIRTEEARILKDVFQQEVKKGYTIGEVILYSGTLD